MAVSVDFPVLLVTSSVGVFAPYTKLSTAEARIAYTLEYLAKWVAIPRLKIVLCDGSSYDYTSLVAAKFPGAEIECLAFENDQNRVAAQGKGWGEGEIIRHALTNSTLLAETDFFAKITGKLFVTNFHDLLALWNGQFLCDCLFQDVYRPHRAVKLYGVDTRFYLANKPFYLENLANVHLSVNDEIGHSIEHNFADAISRQKLRSVIFPIKPRIEGMSGSTGEAYNVRLTLKKNFDDRAKRLMVSLRTPYVSALWPRSQ